MRPRGMWGWCLVCCGKIQYKGKYNWKFICNILSILMEGDRCTGNLPPAEVLPKERLAQWLRYCRIMHMKRRNAPAWTPGQGETAPWTARFDGFVRHRSPSSIIPYSILAAQRSTRGSCVCRSGSRGLHHYIKQEKIIICILRGLRKNLPFCAKPHI